jgi:hypothetical protein
MHALIGCCATVHTLVYFTAMSKQAAAAPIYSTCWHQLINQSISQAINSTPIMMYSMIMMHIVAIGLRPTKRTCAYRQSTAIQAAVQDKGDSC